MTKEAWLANYNEVGDYFGSLKKAIDEVRAENAAKETIYEPLEVELSSPYGTFTPDNVNNLPSMLAKEHESDFNVLKELLQAVWKNYVERIKAHEPDHDAYYEYRHGAEATKLWKENEADIYAFLTTFETLLDAEKERRFGENSAVEDLRLDGKSLVDAIVIQAGRNILNATNSTLISKRGKLTKCWTGSFHKKPLEKPRNSRRKCLELMLIDVLASTFSTT
ncbi:MAG: hypothetical protein IJU03_01770 [Thermoguttaceae bacterium]|nr:hypothetical protein [Thermoguttaceae bacterium]